LISINKYYLKAKLLFVLFILTQSFNILYAYIVLTSLYHSIPNILQINHLFQLSTPGLIFLFSYFLVNPQKKFNGWLLLVFIPLIIGFIFLVPFYFGTVEDKINFQENFQSGNFPLNQKVFFLVKLVNGIVFLVLSILELKKHEMHVFNIYSNIGDKTHRWLRNALFSFLFIWVLVVFVKWQFDFRISTATLAIAVGLMNFYLLFNYLIHIFPLNQEQETEQIQYQLIAEHSKIEELDAAYLEELKAAFLKAVQEKQPYLNADCNMNCFAEQVNIKPYLISTILNQNMGVNFYDFISDLRAETAALLLSNNAKKNLTIDAIAFESGFKSKATFYKAFKKKYHLTPSEYLKQRL
jgi:AraC-like DNA-binding protein